MPGRNLGKASEAGGSPRGIIDCLLIAVTGFAYFVVTPSALPASLAKRLVALPAGIKAPILPKSSAACSGPSSPP